MLELRHERKDGCLGIIRRARVVLESGSVGLQLDVFDGTRSDHPMYGLENRKVHSLRVNHEAINLADAKYPQNVGQIDDRHDDCLLLAQVVLRPLVARLLRHRAKR